MVYMYACAQTTQNPEHRRTMLASASSLLRTACAEAMYEVSGASGSTHTPLSPLCVPALQALHKQLLVQAATQPRMHLTHAFMYRLSACLMCLFVVVMI